MQNQVTYNIFHQTFDTFYFVQGSSAHPILYRRREKGFFPMIIYSLMF